MNSLKRPRHKNERNEYLLISKRQRLSEPDSYKSTGSLVCSDPYVTDVVDESRYWSEYPLSIDFEYLGKPTQSGNGELPNENISVKDVVEKSNESVMCVHDQAFMTAHFKRLTKKMGLQHQLTTVKNKLSKSYRFNVHSSNVEVEDFAKINRYIKRWPDEVTLPADFKGNTRKMAFKLLLSSAKNRLTKKY